MIRRKSAVTNLERGGDDDDWRIGKILYVTADVRLESSRVRWEGGTGHVTPPAASSV